MNGLNVYGKQKRGDCQPIQCFGFSFIVVKQKCNFDAMNYTLDCSQKTRHINGLISPMKTMLHPAAAIHTFNPNNSTETHNNSMFFVVFF
jgi:hypothetical protein